MSQENNQKNKSTRIRRKEHRDNALKSLEQQQAQEAAAQVEQAKALGLHTPKFPPKESEKLAS